MAQEIERKFLVADDSWRTPEALASGVAMRQGYLCRDKARTVRVRLAGGRGTMTVKGATEGFSRLEFEYEIPAEDAADMLEKLALRPLVEKVRYRVPAAAPAGAFWEIDVFEGENAGLIVAEMELPDEAAVFERPAWLGREVSRDPRYFNSNLLAHPYCAWKEEERGGQ